MELSIVKVGGRTERLQSHKYRIPLIDLDGNEVHFDVYGIDKITNNVQNVDVSYIAKLFTDVSTKDIDCPTGEIEVLLGYQYAAYHPQREQNISHLLLLKFFEDLTEMNYVTNKRKVKPDNTEEDPILVIFSDGSTEAYGTCAYVRWRLTNGKYDRQLLLSKNRLAPLKRMSIDRIELSGAILNKRLKKTITTECRYNFQCVYHLVDSQIVHAMIQKETY